MAAPASNPLREPAHNSTHAGVSVDADLLEDPKYCYGRFTTKFLADKTDHNHLEHTNFYATYHGKMLNGLYQTQYSVRSSFNNEQSGLGYWFADAYVKIRQPGNQSWTFRAILNQNAYFLASYKHMLPANVALRAGVEVEIGKTPRYFLKLRKSMESSRVDAIVSGDIRCDGVNIIDTVSVRPRHVIKFKDPLSQVKKVKISGAIDIDVSGGQLKQKRDVALQTKTKLKEGKVFTRIELDRDLVLNSDLAVYHNVTKNLGIYAAYKGSLTRFDGLKTMGTQVKVPEFGKIRTSISSDYLLKNILMYKVHPFASLFQHTQFNVKTNSDLHFGLGLAMGN
jgi:hypothetical protein